MALIIILFVATMFLAYSNGANDNFKGVATLYGSNAVTYEGAIRIATIAQIAGSLISLVLAETLIVAFTGRGLVPKEVMSSTTFIAAVALGAGGTVILATLLGFPISTTHGFVGAITGAGFMAVGTELNLGRLGGTFITPLLISPFLAFGLACLVYWALHRGRQRLGVSTQSCICVRPAHFVPVAMARVSGGTYSVDVQSPRGIEVFVATEKDCSDKYYGKVLGISIQRLVDVTHLISGSAICFARGLNDTPKIAALLLLITALDIQIGVAGIAVAMAIGGVLNGRRVAMTMSKKLACMNDGQAVTANLVAATLIIFASKLGMPVSTTHVTVGAITGVGTVKGTANYRVIAEVVASWVVTLPTGALLGGLTYLALSAMQ